MKFLIIMIIINAVIAIVKNALTKEKNDNSPDHYPTRIMNPAEDNIR